MLISKKRKEKKASIDTSVFGGIYMNMQQLHKFVSTQQPSFDNWVKANSRREVYICTDDGVCTTFPLLLFAEVSPVVQEALHVDIEPNVTVRLVGFLSHTVVSLRQLLMNGHVAMATMDSHIDILLLCGLLRINLDIQTEWRSQDANHEKGSDLIDVDNTCSYGFHEQSIITSNSAYAESIGTAPVDLGEHQSEFGTISPISHGTTERMIRWKAAALSGSRALMGAAECGNSDQSETAVNDNDDDCDYIISESEERDSNESESTYKKQFNTADCVSSVGSVNGRRTRQKTKTALSGSGDLLAAQDGSNSDQSKTTVNDNDDDSDYIVSESEECDSESESTYKKQLNITDSVSSVRSVNGRRTRQKSEALLSCNKDLDRPADDIISRKKSICNSPLLAQLDSTNNIPDSGEHESESENRPFPRGTTLGRKSCHCPPLRPHCRRAIYTRICHCCNVEMKSFSVYSHHRLRKIIGIENIRITEMSLLKKAASLIKESSSSLFCTVCSFNFGRTSMPHIAKHMTSEACINLKMYHCTICDRRFQWECDLAVHVLEHEPEHWMISCKHCGTRFPSPTVFIHHWQNACKRQGKVSTFPVNQLDHKKVDNSICALLPSPVSQLDVRTVHGISSKQLLEPEKSFEFNKDLVIMEPEVQVKNWVEERQQMSTYVEAGFAIASCNSDGSPGAIDINDSNTAVTTIPVDGVDHREQNLRSSKTSTTNSSKQECQVLENTKAVDISVHQAEIHARENMICHISRCPSTVDSSIHVSPKQLCTDDESTNKEKSCITVEGGNTISKNFSEQMTATDFMHSTDCTNEKRMRRKRKAPLIDRGDLKGPAEADGTNRSESPIDYSDNDSDYELLELAEPGECDSESASTSKQQGNCISPLALQQNNTENIPDSGDHESEESRILTRAIEKMEASALLISEMRSQQGQKRSQIHIECTCQQFGMMKRRGIYSSCHCCKKAMTFRKYAHHRLNNIIGEGKIRLMEQSLLKEAEAHYTEASGSFCCKLCSFVSSTLLHILCHLSGEGCANLKMFQCTTCFEKFNSECQLASHILEHEPAEHWIITCKKCDIRFPSIHRFRQHWNSSCRTGQAVTCRHCNKRFATEMFYALHFLNIALEKKELQTLLENNKQHERDIVDMHAIKDSNLLTGTTTYKCKYCDFSNRIHGRMFQHIVSQLHVDLKIYKCPGCSKNFCSKWSLAKHYLSHVSQEYWLHECEKCNLRLHSGSSLRNHMNIVHSKKKFLCHICSKFHVTKENLDIHMRSHTGERPYKCDRCPKTFALHYSFKKHMRAHDGIRRYTCDICSNKFNEKLDLKKHVNSVHLKLRPFECDECDAKYSTKQGLESHYRRVHRKSK